MTKTISFSKKFLFDQNITNEQFLIGCVLLFVYHYYDHAPINVESIAYSIYGSEYKSKHINIIKEAINNLDKNKYIHIEETFKNTYKIKFKELIVEKKFVIIRYKDFVKILKFESDAPGMLRLFSMIISNRKYSKIDYMSYKAMNTPIDIMLSDNGFGMSDYYIRKYTKILTNEKILYCIRYKNNCMCQHCCYSLYEDSAYCMKFVYDIGGDIIETSDDINDEDIFEKHYTTNEKRRYKQIYHRMCAGHLEYSQDLIKEVKDYIYYCNELIAAGKYNGELLDTNVFSIYEKYLNLPH